MADTRYLFLLSVQVLTHDILRQRSDASVYRIVAKSDNQRQRYHDLILSSHAIDIDSPKTDAALCSVVYGVEARERAVREVAL